MDQHWVEHLVESYEKELKAYMIRHAQSWEDAEDILQQTWLDCVKYRDSFDPEHYTERVWVWLTAKRCLSNFYDRAKPEGGMSSLDDEDMPEQSDSAADQAMSMAENRALLAKALGALDERSRNIVLLHAIKGWSHDRIADAMGLSASNVMQIYSRSVKKMRAALEDSE